MFGACEFVCMCVYVCVMSYMFKWEHVCVWSLNMFKTTGG